MSEEIASFLILNAVQKYQIVDNPSQLTNIASVIADKAKEYNVTVVEVERGQV
jgi:hypothetical protein